MTLEELKAAKVPFKVKCNIKGGGSGVIVGFSQNDPLGVGGGIFPDMPTAHFKNGGWLLVKDLLEHWDIVPEPSPQDSAPK